MEKGRERQRRQGNRVKKRRNKYNGEEQRKKSLFKGGRKQIDGGKDSKRILMGEKINQVGGRGGNWKGRRGRA